MVGTEKKNSTKFQIINYIINHKATSKVELSRNLNLSMPTVLSNVNELLASGIVVEMGEYESTGGRKAKMISINPAYRYAVGIRITAKHVGFVLVNLKSEIEKYERIRLEFSTETSYYSRLREELHHFLEMCIRDRTGNDIQLYSRVLDGAGADPYLLCKSQDPAKQWRIQYRKGRRCRRQVDSSDHAFDDRSSGASVVLCLHDPK